MASSEANIFDDLPALRAPKATKMRDEFESYLSTNRDLQVDDGLVWWHERKHIYPRLYRMAMDYLSIPGKLPRLLFLMYILANTYCSHISARAGCYSRMYVAGYRFSLHALSCASVYGV